MYFIKRKNILILSGNSLKDQQTERQSQHHQKQNLRERKQFLSVIKILKKKNLLKKGNFTKQQVISYRPERENELNKEINSLKITSKHFKISSFFLHNQINLTHCYPEIINLSLRGGGCRYSTINKEISQTWTQCDELPGLIPQSDNHGEMLGIIFTRKNLISYSDKQIYFWNLKSGKIIDVLNLNDLLSQHESYLEDRYSLQKIFEVQLSPDQQKISIVYHVKSNVETYSVQQFDIQARFSNGLREMFQSFMPVCCFSHDSTLLAFSVKGYIFFFNKTEIDGSGFKFHEQKINQILFTPYDQILISCGQDTYIHLWRVKEKQLFRTFNAHESFVTNIDLSSDGLTLASCCAKSIKLWSLEPLKEILILKDQTFHQFKLLNNGKLVSYDKSVEIWDIKEGKLLKNIEKSSNQVQFTPDEKVLVIQNNHKIELWDIEEGKMISIILGQSKQLRSLVFKPEIQKECYILATISEKESVIHLWKYKIQNKVIKNRSVGFSPDGKIIYSYGQDQIVRLWNAQDGKQFQYLEIAKYCRKISFSNKGEFLLLQADAVDLWYFKENRLVELKEESSEQKPIRWFEIQQQGVFLALIFCGSKKNKIEIYDIKLQKQVALLETNERKVTYVKFSPDGELLAFIGDGYLLQIWNLQTFKLIVSFQNVQNMLFSPNSRIIVAWNYHQRFRLSYLSGIEFATIQYNDEIYFSPNNQVIITSDDKGYGALWNVKDGELIKCLPKIQGLRRQCVFSLDGQIVASSDKNNVIIIDIKEKASIRYLRGHISQIMHISFSHNSQMLVSSSEDQIIVWDYIKEQKIIQFSELQINIRFVFFSPNDQVMVSQEQTQIVFWNIKTWEIIYTQQTDEYFSCIILSPDGRLACFCEKSKLWIFYLQDWKEAICRHAHNYCIKKLTFSQDGSVLVSYSPYDRCVFFWDTSTWNIINVYQPCLFKNNILLSNDDKLLTSNRAGSNIKLYDSESGKVIVNYNIFKTYVQEILFSPDSKLLSNCQSDFTLKLWI